MSVRRTTRTLAAAIAAATALTVLAGCSLIPGLGSGTSTTSAPPAAPSATATRSASATRAVVPKPSGAVAKIVTKTTVTTNSITLNVNKPWTDVSEDIDGVKARQVEEAGGLLVDLRPRPDFRKRHIEGATNVPMWQFTTVAQTWDKNGSIILYDETGANGQTAQTWLERNGFHRIYHLYRGIEGYDEGLVGTDPKPFPPKEPVLYYFYVKWDPRKPVTDTFVEGLEAEFPGEFELHKVNAFTLAGIVELLEFGGLPSASGPLPNVQIAPSATANVPTFRLVDEQGHDEQYTGYDQLVKIRAHLKHAVEKYRAGEY